MRTPALLSSVLSMLGIVAIAAPAAAQFRVPEVYVDPRWAPPILAGAAPLATLLVMAIAASVVTAILALALYAGDHPAGRRRSA